MKPLLIVNPASAAGRTGRAFGAIEAAVRSVLGELEARFTRAVGDGVSLGREAAEAGRRLVVAVGGDGTASEVIDGLAHGRYRGEFGFIPCGTGGDLRRTLNIPRDVRGAAQALGASAPRVIDLGLVEFTGRDGAPARRHFANVASCGLSGLVVDRVNRSSKLLGGRLTFKLASARALLGWRDQRVRWRADGGPWTETSVTALSVCNARFFGGGMMVAPAAEVDDGLLDVTIWSGFGLVDFVLKQPQIYDGRHVGLPNTRVLRARVVEVEPLEDAPILLEADGEQPGRLPARFSVQPGALVVRFGGKAGAGRPSFMTARCSRYRLRTHRYSSLVSRSSREMPRMASSSATETSSSAAETAKRPWRTASFSSWEARSRSSRVARKFQVPPVSWFCSLARRATSEAWSGGRRPHSASSRSIRASSASLTSASTLATRASTNA